MKLLHMICGKTLTDGRSNKVILEMTTVEKIKWFLSKQRLQWIGHIKKMDDERASVKAKQTWFQEDEAYQHSWNKWVMIN